MNIVNLAHKIQIELVKLLFQQIKYALWAETFTALCLAVALWGAQDTVLLLGWLSFNLIFCGAARHVMVYFFHRYIHEKNLTYEKALVWLIIFSIGTFISGISWGMAGSVLMMNEDVMRQTFQIILLIGITAGANPIYSPCRQVYLIFLLPAFLPLVVWLALQGGIFLLLSLLGIAYVLIMLASSFYSHKLITASLGLGFQNSELVEHLSQAKEMLETRSTELEKSLSLVNATLEASTDGFLVVDSNHNLESFNKNFIDMWKIPIVLTKEKDAEKKIIHYVKDQLVDPAAFDERIKNLYTNPFIESFDELLFKDGRVFERYSRPQMLGEECVGRVWSFRDVTGRKLLESRLYKQANYDLLTGLPNRVLVQDRISQAILYANKQKFLVAVLFIDLDRFKMINDTLGHLIGDKLLKSVAERLSSCVKANDTVARVGGDEFLIILNSLKNETDAIEIARRCIQSFSNPILIENNKYNISLSIGISFYPQDGTDPEVLIRNADIAMYKAKEMGTSEFLCFTEELNNKIQNRLLLENQLREALNRNELAVWYQPILSLHTGCIIGAEALLRWEHPVLGNIEPAEFISIAEESGIILPIGEWTLKAASQQIQKWHEMGFDNLYVSVNLSARQFSQPNLFEKIIAILLEAHLRPGSLMLELTENLIMSDIDKNIRLLNKLKKLSIMLAMDDFGIGYSSLNYLKQLPLDKLKIDISFVKEIGLHSDGAAITAAIIALARNLNLQVIAEGVEEKEQLEFLINHRCDEMQGFYFSKPLDAKTFTQLLETKPYLASEI